MNKPDENRKRTTSRRHVLAQGARIAYVAPVVVVSMQVGQVDVGAESGISIFRECIKDHGDGTYTAYFGYLNRETTAVNVPLGPNNKLTGNVISGSPVTTFQPGRVGIAFGIVFDGNNLVWTLAYGGARKTTTANKTQKACETVSG